MRLNGSEPPAWIWIHIAHVWRLTGLSVVQRIDDTDWELEAFFRGSESGLHLAEIQHRWGWWATAAGREDHIRRWGRVVLQIAENGNSPELRSSADMQRLTAEMTTAPKWWPDEAAALVAVIASGGAALTPECLPGWSTMPQPPGAPELVTQLPAKITELHRHLRRWVLNARSGDDTLVPAAWVDGYHLMRRPGRRGRSDVEYALICRRYIAAVRRNPRAPMKELVPRFYNSVGTVNAALKKAETRGLITGRRQGRAGGVLTEKAERMLAHIEEEEWD